MFFSNIGVVETSSCEQNDPGISGLWYVNEIPVNNFADHRDEFIIMIRTGQTRDCERMAKPRKMFSHPERLMPERTQHLCDGITVHEAGIENR